MISRHCTLEELMKQFNPQFMTAIGQCSVGSVGEVQHGFAQALLSFEALGMFYTTANDDGVKWMKPEDKLRAKAVFVGLHADLERMGLSNSAATARRLVEAFDAQRLSATWITQLAQDVCQRLADEMKSRLFYSVEFNKQPYLSEAPQFGEQVQRQFGAADFDIQEAARCLAFDRWTAAVFHMMRVSEIATVEIAERVGYVSEKPSFGGALEYLDLGLQQVRKKPNEADPRFLVATEFLNEVLGNMRAVNVAWRQRVAHMEKKYTEEEAVRIWEATKGLMRHLASKLKEEPNG